MNYWDVIQDAFNKDLPGFNRIKNSFMFFSWSKKIFFMLISTSFLLLVCFFIDQDHKLIKLMFHYILSDDLFEKSKNIFKKIDAYCYVENIFLILSCVPAYFIVRMLNHTQKMQFLERCHKQGLFIVPTQDNERSQGNRYCLFEDHLRQAGITPKHVRACFVLLEMQIQLEKMRKSKNISLKPDFSMFSSWLSSITSFNKGGLIPILGLDNAYKFSLVSSVFLYGYLIFYIVCSSFFSKREKLQELKGFMELYCAEPVRQGDDISSPFSSLHTKDQTTTQEGIE